MAVLRLGDEAPDFTAKTSEGDINFQGENEEELFSISLYPNPVVDIVTIQHNAIEGGKGVVYDARGIIVEEIFLV